MTLPATIGRPVRSGLRLAALTALATLVPHAAHAQLAPATDSLLHRIFASRDLVPQGVGRLAWLPGRDAYTTLEPDPAERDASDIVRYDAATGARDVLVSATALRPAGADRPLAIDGYAFTPDLARVLLFTNAHRSWHHGTPLGDYWVLDRHTGALRKLGGPDVAPATMRYAKFSPQGDRVAYVRDADLYVENLAGGAITRLTTDGSATILNGFADWVDDEELYLRDCFRWSPDGTAIAYWQFDQSGVADYLLVNDTDSLYPFVVRQPYPVPGGTNSAVRAGVVSATGGPTTWLRLSGDPRQNYIPSLDWTGPHELVLQYLNRYQNRDEVMLADAITGAAHPILTETDSAWVDVKTAIQWIDGGRRFLWSSDRDGWRHIYAVSHDGSTVTLLTPGPYDVEGIEGVDEANGWLYILASPDNATQRYLYRVSLRTPGAPRRVTPAADSGWNQYDISPDGRWAVHTYSTFDTPPVTDLVALPAHAPTRMLASDARLRAAVAALADPPVKFIKVPVGDGVTLDGWIMTPRHLDQTRKYPVFVYVYGEPAGQTVTDRWGGALTLWHHLIADLGYVVVSVDNEGTPAPRGRRWRKSVYGAIGPLASREQAAAVRYLTRTIRWLDSTRVGIQGHSGGGSQTLNALFRYPDVYQVGEAVSPVPDQRFYDSIYEERYVGLPQDHPENYRVSSPINFADGLRGHLLLVHGTGDDNVHDKGSEALANRLIALGKPFDFEVYPNRSHCICDGPGTTLSLYTLLTRYLVLNLPAGPR